MCSKKLEPARFIARARGLLNMRSEGLEPPTYKFVACCSIQLSYDRMFVSHPRDLAWYSVIITFPFTMRAMRFGEGGIRTPDTVLSV
jgi:hypothetical protein